MDKMPLASFRDLSARRKVLVGIAYVAIWVALDFLAGQFSSEKVNCSWYPNAGTSFGFLIFFGWPMALLEVFCRILMAVLLWNVDLNAARLVSYCVLPAMFSVVLAYPVRRAIMFAGRTASSRVALAFTVLVIFGNAVKAALLQIANTITGVFEAENFLLDLAIWYAGDMIGTATFAPLLIVVIGPALLSRPYRFFSKGGLPAAAAIVLGLGMCFWLLASYLPERHYLFWHLVIPFHVAAAWLLGFRWMTIQVVLVNLSLSLLELYLPSKAYPIEQQGFLTLITGGALFLGILFEEGKVYLARVSRMTEALGEASKKGALFSNVFSHELRTPLAVIQGYADLMQKMPDPAQDPERLRRLRGQAYALSKILSQLTVLGEPQNAWENAEPELVDLRALVSEVAATFEKEASEKGIRIEWDRQNAPALQTVTFPAGVRLALEALLSNAVKFTAAGFVRLSIEEGKGAQLRVLVADSGMGMDPGYEPFGSFEQESGGLTRTQGGLGIGLSVSRLIMEAMGGEVYLAKTARGEGSLFILQVTSWPS